MKNISIYEPQTSHNIIYLIHRASTTKYKINLSVVLFRFKLAYIPVHGPGGLNIFSFLTRVK